MRKTKFPLRILLLTVALFGIGLACWSNSTITSIHEDFTYWPPGIPPDLNGREIRIIGNDRNGQPLDGSARIIDVDLTVIANAEITIKMSPSLKWRTYDFDSQQIGWYCPYFNRGGAIKK